MVMHVWLHKTKTNMHAELWLTEHPEEGRLDGLRSFLFSSSSYLADKGSISPLLWSLWIRTTVLRRKESSGSLFAGLHPRSPEFYWEQLEATGLHGGLSDQWSDRLRPRWRANGTAAVQLRRWTHVQVKTHELSFTPLLTRTAYINHTSDVCTTSIYDALGLLV